MPSSGYRIAGNLPSQPFRYIVEQEQYFSRDVGAKQYELKDHLGNVRAVVSDRRIAVVENGTIANFTELLTYSDYYPFGMVMPGRNYNFSDYRYGFNGKEKDDRGEWGSTHYDYGFRIYDPQIAKFLSVDPLAPHYPELTPYQFASNKPIDGIDLDGLEYYSIHVNIHDGTGRSQIKIEDHTNMTDNQIREVHKMSPTKFYKKYSKSFGPEGRGVLYIYSYYENGKFVGSEEKMELEPGILRSGVYYGAGSITITGSIKGYLPQNEIEAWNYYDYSDRILPIHEPDRGGKNHDILYATFDNPGKLQWLLDERTLEADIEFVTDLMIYRNNARFIKDYEDAETNRAPSKEAKRAAERAIVAFSDIAKTKFGIRGAKQLMQKVNDRYYEKKKSREGSRNDAKNEIRKIKRINWTDWGRKGRF